MTEARTYDYVFMGTCPLAENPTGTHFTSSINDLHYHSELWVEEIAKSGYDVQKAFDSGSLEIERYDCKCSQCKCRS